MKKRLLALILAATMITTSLQVYAATDGVYDDNAETVVTATDSDADEEETVSDDDTVDGEVDIDFLDENEDIDTLGVSNPFTDINSSQAFYDAVMWAYNAKPQVVAGVTANKFKPYKICNRAQIVSFLWRMMGCPEPSTTRNPFTDVKSSDFFYKPVLWAYEKGITSGVKSNLFGATDECTRAQFATFLWNASNKPAPKLTTSPFNDVAMGKFYSNAVLWAYENGITSGKNASSFAPNNKVNRGQAVMFLYRCKMMKKSYNTSLNGVDYSAVYNYNFYINKYPDLKKAFGDDTAKALNHFVNFGMKEGRQASANFNVYAYVCRYQDLRKVYRYNLKNYYLHYIRNGKAEGRLAVGAQNKSNAWDAIYDSTDIAEYPYEYYNIIFNAQYEMNALKKGNGSFVFADFERYYGDYIIYWSTTDDFGYLITDINEDGVNDLLLCVGDNVAQLYTVVDGETVRVIDGFYHYKFKYLGNSRFAIFGWDSSVKTSTYICKMNYSIKVDYSNYTRDYYDSKESLPVIEGYESYRNSDFYTLTGFADGHGSENTYRKGKASITSSQYESYSKGMPTVKLNAIPLIGTNPYDYYH